MASGGGRERYGSVGRRLAAAVDDVAGVLAELDCDLVGGRDAMDMVAELSRLEHLASAGLMLAARRVAQTDLWRRSGHRTAGHWLSQVTGVSVGEAIGLLETAEVVEDAPDTRDALRAGKVSTRQAKAIGAAEKADPHAGRRMLGEVDKKSTKETESESKRIVAAASGETPEQKAERHRRNRRFWHGVDADGMGVGGWRLPMPEHLRLVSGVDAEQGVVFDEKRAAGEREPVEAYAADAFCRLVDRALNRSRRAAGEPEAAAEDGGGGAGEDWSFAKVIVKVDLTALDRGRVEAGEVCEVAGQGPVAVEDVWRMIDGDAFVAAVSTRGTEISKVVHLGRRPTVLQRTALDWLGDGCCAIDGCTSKARLEIDHVAAWAATGRTELRQLARVCGLHHDLKTHNGYRFGPLQPNGKRQLIPPDEQAAPPRSSDPPDEHHDGRPPGGTGPPVLTVHDGRPGPTPPPRQRRDRATRPLRHRLIGPPEDPGRGDGRAGRLRARPRSRGSGAEPRTDAAGPRDRGGTQWGTAPIG